MELVEGLEAAHEKEIIHRDLKPANIKITPERKPKILDFGLATAYRRKELAANLSESPTVTKATATGVILGTVPYMSPEQAKGKSVDKRADIWAFGCVLFESLTGRSAFLGETVSDTFARILEREPGWEALPDDTPPLVRLLLHQCLQKDARERLHDIADARIGIKEASTDSFRNLFSRDSVSGVPSRRGWTPWVVASCSAVLIIVALWAPWRARPTEGTVSRFATTLPTGQTMRDVVSSDRPWPYHPTAASSSMWRGKGTRRGFTGAR